MGAISCLYLRHEQPRKKACHGKCDVVRDVNVPGSTCTMSWHVTCHVLYHVMLTPRKHTRPSVMITSLSKVAQLRVSFHGEFPSTFGYCGGYYGGYLVTMAHGCKMVTMMVTWLL